MLHLLFITGSTIRSCLPPANRFTSLWSFALPRSHASPPIFAFRVPFERSFFHYWKSIFSSILRSRACTVLERILCAAAAPSMRNAVGDTYLFEVFHVSTHSGSQRAIKIKFNSLYEINMSKIKIKSLQICRYEILSDFVPHFTWHPQIQWQPRFPFSVLSRLTCAPLIFCRHIGTATMKL